MVAALIADGFRNYLRAHHRRLRVSSAVTGLPLNVDKGGCSEKKSGPLRSLPSVGWSVLVVCLRGQNNYFCIGTTFSSLMASTRNCWSFVEASIKSFSLTILYLSKTLRVR